MSLSYSQNNQPDSPGGSKVLPRAGRREKPVGLPGGVMMYTPK